MNHFNDNQTIIDAIILETTITKNAVQPKNPATTKNTRLSTGTDIAEDKSILSFMGLFVLVYTAQSVASETIKANADAIAINGSAIK